MKLSVSAYRAHASAHKKILSSSNYQTQFNYGSTAAAASGSTPTSSALFSVNALLFLLLLPLLLLPSLLQLTTTTTTVSTIKHCHHFHNLNAIVTQNIIYSV